MEYKVNDDGSVTRINAGGNNNSNNSSGSSSNNGCIWFIIIAIILGGIILAISNSNSNSTNMEESDTDSVAIEDIEADTAIVEEEDYSQTTTYLNVSDDDIYISADGGTEEITVSTDGEWYIDVDVASWGHLTKYSNSISIRLDRNTSSSSRDDYFVIKSGNYTKRINITQYGDSSPKAEIESIWMDHNITQNGVRGMKIHVKFTIDNMKDKTIYTYAYFYWGDNVTPLHDQYNNDLSFRGYGTPSYDNARFDDFGIFVPYSGLNMKPGLGTVELSFDISVKTSSGTELARKNNTQITFNN